MTKRAAIMLRLAIRKQQILLHEQFAQIADRFDGFLLARHRLEAMPHFAPRRWPAEPHCLVHIVSRLFKRREPPRPRCVLDDDRRNDREVVHLTSVARIEREPHPREISVCARLCGGAGSCGTSPAYQKLTERCGHLRRFEAQRTISLTPSLPKAAAPVVRLRDTTQQIG